MFPALWLHFLVSINLGTMSFSHLNSLHQENSPPTACVNKAPSLSLHCIMLMQPALCVSRDNLEVAYVVYFQWKWPLFCDSTVLLFLFLLRAFGGINNCVQTIRILYLFVPLVRDVSVASGGANVECSSKPTPPKTSDPAPSVSPSAATAAAVQSPTAKDESKKKKPEKKGNSWNNS